MGNKLSIRKKSKQEIKITPGQTQRETPSNPNIDQKEDHRSNYQQHNNYNYQSNYVSVATYNNPNNNPNDDYKQIDNDDNNNNHQIYYNVYKPSNIHQNQPKNIPSLWFRIDIKGKDNSNEKLLIKGIYRKVQFIDTMHHSQTRGGIDDEFDINIPSKMSQYDRYYTSATNVYVKLYNSENQPLDQKKENVFLWNDGNQWIFSNYQSLHYFIDFDNNSKQKWVIKPERNSDNILISSCNQYGADLNIMKKSEKVIFRNTLNAEFELIITSEYGQNLGFHQQQFEEDPTHRSTYVLWRENLNVFYQRNQLFTLEQLKDEEQKTEHEREAKEVNKLVEEINDICLSIEFRQLLKKYQDKSIKCNGWMNKGEIKIMINDDTYNQFHKMYIDNKNNKELGRIEVRDVVLQFHKFYCQLLNELNELNGFDYAGVTYR